MIDRKILKELEGELTKKHITALVGARQVGKSTILKVLFEKVKEKSIYIKFDKVDILNLFDNEIESFIAQYIVPYDYIFIDEIQYSQKSGKYLKYIVDEYDNKKIFVTGSSTPELSIKTFSYLVGRIRIINLYGISFEEFVNYKDKVKLPLLKKRYLQSSLKQFKNLFVEFLMYGNYPSVVVETNIEEKKKIIKDISNVYLLKEIRDILNYKNLYQFELLLKRISLADGNLLNYSNIAGDLDISSKKVKEMVSILDKTFVLSILNPYLDNKIKELVRTPKTYYLDLGFKNGIVNNFTELNFRIDKGSVYESFILKEMLIMGLKPSFWNYKNEYEVDFVLEKDGKTYGFEVKSKLNNVTLTTSMKKFIESCSPKILYVFNENVDDELLYNDTRVIFTNYINAISIFGIMD